MINKVTLYVRSQRGVIVSTMESPCLVYRGRATQQWIIGFAPFVEYHVESIRESRDEWFCLDEAGRNYGVSPHGVYAKTTDLRSVIEDNYHIIYGGSHAGVI